MSAVRNAEDLEVGTSKAADDRTGSPDTIPGEFDLAWRNGQRPSLESYLLRAAAADRDALLGDLLVIEVEHRRRLGEAVSLDEYVRRFPDDDEALYSFASRCQMPAGHTTLVEELATANTVGVTQATAAARYGDLRFHARGGLGEVFRANDDSIGRQVALKFIHAHFFHDPANRERFLLEAKITGRMDHPGVVPVHAIGETFEGRPFYAMRFIEGKTFREVIDQFHRTQQDRRSRRLELHRLLEHLVAICNTLAYSHNRGIVHRDIKPENVMIGKFGETLVLDWGLAVSISRDDRAKASGELTLMPGVEGCSSPSAGGTIGYMSPEQVPDSVQQVGLASDIYSLGATLYKLLTGVPPLIGRPSPELWDRIRRGDFPRPTAVREDVPKALEAVCLKAMAVNPGDRYASALELAADLQAWMADEPTSVYREPRFERVLRIARRHRSWTRALGVASLVIFAAVLITGLAMAKLAQREYAVRIASDKARDRSLQLSASFAAQAIADVVDRRWRVLDELAADPELSSLLRATQGQGADSPEWVALQRWLANQADRALSPLDKTDSWSLFNADGVMLARKPQDEELIGRSFHTRTYFHGGAQDLPADTAISSVEPIRRPTLSHAYRSKARNRFLRVTFSVPIWRDGQSSSETKPIGILTMSVLPGQLRIAENAILIDSREDLIDGSARRGVILQHPQMRDRSSPQEVARISAGQLATLVARADELAAIESGDEDATQQKSALVRDFIDPLATNARPLSAAVAPVLVRTFQKVKDFESGWIVVVAEGVGDAAATQNAK